MYGNKPIRACALLIKLHYAIISNEFLTFGGQYYEYCYVR